LPKLFKIFSAPEIFISSVLYSGIRFTIYSGYSDTTANLSDIQGPTPYNATVTAINFVPPTKRLSTV
tara:strand:+ start:142 stop:342 length:201 start_codon:yes stop_codon:yes gene_type:complete